ncbi:BnaC09g28780D [Brassica napus]|uniref:BnaC09g28780D protein n=2 Tax=Brassica TaxID=3705 RepID=A0A078GQZ8_BRANA|nr:BnaC09g28780D [Brassica napus]VDD31787.1 unnamed protein product [Brassica oleracea]
MEFCYVVHAVARLSYMSVRQEQTLERSTSFFANTLRMMACTERKNGMRVLKRKRKS